MQINYEDKYFNFQLDINPDLTLELIQHAVLTFLKTEEIIFFQTNDNEILLLNTKIIDLILLNPKKYKSLRVITSSNYKATTLGNNNNSNYSSNNVGNNNPIKNNYSDYQACKYDNLYPDPNANNRDYLGKKYEQKEYDNLDATYNKKTRENANPVANNYMIPNDVNLVTEKRLDNINNLDNDYMYKSDLNEVNDNDFRAKTKIYSNKSNDLLNSPTLSGKNPITDDLNYSKNKIDKMLTSPTNQIINENYDANINRYGYDKFDKQIIDDNFIAITDNYKFKPTDYSNNNNFNNKFDNERLGNLNREKDSNNSTNTGNTYNYTERFKEDLNRQRFASERRTFRTNQNIPGNPDDKDNQSDKKFDYKFDNKLDNMANTGKYVSKYSNNENTHPSNNVEKENYLFKETDIKTKPSKLNFRIFR